MTKATHVYLITGFLGSGKTTLLNRLIKQVPENTKLMVLMNEFGDIGIDGKLIEGEEIDMLEISKGSIFCVCVKSDFIKALKEIAQKNPPDVLLVESTGVADPTGFDKDLKLPVYGHCYEPREKICVLDAAHFLDTYETYAALEKQIAECRRFIINKTDLAGPESISKIKEIVRTHCPEPIFYETQYCDLDFCFLFQDLQDKDSSTVQADHSLAHLQGQELERYITEKLMKEASTGQPPDQLMSIAVRWKGEGREKLTTLIENFPPEIIRAKGFCLDGGQRQLFNYINGTWSLEPHPGTGQGEDSNLIVLIGAPRAALEIHDWPQRFGVEVIS